MSMAAGEYVSVHLQADTEQADLELERAELRADDRGEQKELTAIYAPPLGKYTQLELLGGIGGLSTRFYTQTYTCNYFSYSCTNYYSSNHFMGDVGAGVRVYLTHGVFLRPEFREYFIHNNVEFSSNHATRAGVTLGYSFGHQH